MHLVLQNVWQMHESFKNTVQLHIMQRSRKTYALCMKINLAEINSKRTVLSYTKCNYVIWRSNVSTLGLQFSNCARTLEKLMCASGRRHQDLSIAGPCAFWGRRENFRHTLACTIFPYIAKVRPGTYLSDKRIVQLYNNCSGNGQVSKKMLDLGSRFYCFRR